MNEMSWHDKAAKWVVENVTHHKYGQLRPLDKTLVKSMMVVVVIAILF